MSLCTTQERRFSPLPRPLSPTLSPRGRGERESDLDAMTPPLRVQLHRALSKLGVCSRAQAADVIRAGRVRVNGRPALDPLTWVSVGGDRIEVDGKPVAARDDGARWYLLHKPRGYVTTRRDEHGRATVYDLLPDEAKTDWLFPVGRLDRESEGLLLFTDDGPAADRLTDPTSHVAKIYDVRLDHPPGDEDLARLRAGIALEHGGRPTLPATITPLPDGGYRVVLREGRNRQIRRMFEAVGCKVQRLVRTDIGQLRLHDLPAGEGRWLTPDEIARLFAGARPAITRPATASASAVPRSAPGRRPRQRVTRPPGRRK